jgi:hypothetical protein
LTLFAAVPALLASGAVAAWSFVGIVRWYKKPSAAFPWLLSLIFAGAAVGAILTLHALIRI